MSRCNKYSPKTDTGDSGTASTGSEAGVKLEEPVCDSCRGNHTTETHFMLLFKPEDPVCSLCSNSHTTEAHARMSVKEEESECNNCGKDHETNHCVKEIDVVGESKPDPEPKPEPEPEPSDGQGKPKTEPNDDQLQA
ncbi:hypothetical protein H4R18_004361 [Coemansia javaensis]|uniref:Uncharacterized protein n=1 Tax=Coemansia javaensis TaxID=2761396 RepID=A0A9W8LFW8_9FUNG|nr:hypothetical protein H4R18_004361 [Coemansia javaensis]